MTILTGSKRVTVADLMARIAALEADLNAPEAEKPAKRAKAEMPAFRTKAQRAAGKGHACRAGCSRKDLRTYKRAGSHDLETGHIAR